MSRYVIGVDGGNTKTDYLLFTVDGKFIDGLRSGTCSHESPKVGGFKAAYEIMKTNIFDLLQKNNLSIDDVECAVFGLAGIDVPFQKASLMAEVDNMGLKKYLIVNDGFLGVKASSKSGTGVCCINGTGTVNVGVDSLGNTIQVGGIGFEAGDEGGGSYLARCAIRAAFDDSYRFGKKTVITDKVFEMFGISNRDELANAILYKKTDSTFLIKALFAAANNGDEEAIRILRYSGTQMGRSCSGVISQLTFNEKVEVIMAGGVWAHATNNEIIDAFKETVSSLTKKDCEFFVMDLPPVLGAILWAIELATNKLPSSSTKECVLEAIYQYNKRF